MLLPGNIPVNITPENVWTVLDTVESDFGDDFADVMADVMDDSDTEFGVEDEQKDNDKDEYQEADTSTISDRNQSLHTIVSDSGKDNDTDVQDKKIKLNGDVLLDIDTLDNPLKVFEKLINLDEFLHHLKLESERYAAENGKTFEVSMDELRASISVNFVMGYHEMPKLGSYWETGSPSLSVNFIANVMARERFKEVLGNLHFSNNKDAIP